MQAQAGAACAPGASDTASRNACAVQRFQQADSAQNILYGDVMRALSAHERPALRKDQSAWSRQRTSTCKARHAGDEGRLSPLEQLLLTIDTELRVAEPGALSPARLDALRQRLAAAYDLISATLLG